MLESNAFWERRSKQPGLLQPGDNKNQYIGGSGIDLK